MGSLHDRCSLHPQRRIVGICAHCLQERLTILIESISPEDAMDGAGETHSRQISIEELRRQPPPRAHPVSHERSASNSHFNTKTSADMALHSHAKLEDSLNLALQKVKHAHQQLSYVAKSPHQGVIKLGPAASPLILPRGASDKHVSLPASCRRSNASESDMKSLPGLLHISGKRRGSWFSISKGKNPLLNSPLRQNTDNNCLHKSPQVMILAGRKSASDAIGRPCNSYRQAYMADLESIAEINLGEAAIKVQPNESNGDAHANPSWISSLFHWKKGSRYKPDERHDVGITNSAVNGKAASFAPADASVNRSPVPAFEAGRLSWDGPRPSFKQMMKRIEARKKQQRVDCSPMHHLATDKSKDDVIGDQALTLQKCKSVASSRRSISVEMQQQASISPMSHNNVNSQMECSNGYMIDREPKSWGRAWNRTLSPLLGFRNNGRKGNNDSSYPHPGYATPNPAHFKSSLGALPSSSSYKTPLSRSKCTPDAQIQIAH